jgi:hypothetical protein
MKRLSIAGLALSGLLLSSGLAAAQTAAPAAAPAPRGIGPRMVERMCGAPVKPPSGRYAERLAERLTLTDAQKATLKTWQDTRQKAREDARAVMCSPKPDLSTFAGRLDWRGKRLETQLATFKAERPKMEAFYASLDDKQKAAWDEVRSRAEERRAGRRR